MIPSAGQGTANHPPHAMSAPAWCHQAAQPSVCSFLPYDHNPGLPHTGSWAALDPATGAILWQTPDPSGSFDTGALTTSNGVVYAGSMSGHMYALDAATGAVLYWGNGYGRFGLGTPSTTFYALSLNGK